eukprot:scaffold160737_cov21-Tisochrysis_lutea.AAC.1
MILHATSLRVEGRAHSAACPGAACPACNMAEPYPQGFLQAAPANDALLVGRKGINPHAQSCGHMGAKELKKTREAKKIINPGTQRK